ncbi:MAG: glycyl-radical enzyme activating protein [Candidatus Thorarchaeota archaeon]
MKDNGMKDNGSPVSGIIFDIKKYAIHDGPGIRTTIFFKGCSLSCWWCQNPESQKPGIEKLQKLNFDSNSISQEEIIGRKVSVEEVINDIEKDLIFYDESGGGVTFSGGEPLLQLEFLDCLLTACKERGISTVLDTSGYAPWEAIAKIKDKVDLFLYDLKIINDQEHQKYTGVSNKQVLANLERLDREGKNIIIRIPVIPEITETEEEINLMINWLQKLQTTREINLLPFHKFGKGKYARWNIENRLPDLEPPSTERLTYLKKKFSALGFQVKIGG